MSNDLVETNIDDKKELIKSLYGKGLDDKEFEHFLIVCKKMDLNPLAKQIYVYKMGGKMTIIVGIDGLRLVADRSKQYAPGKETTYQYKPDSKTLLSATSYIKKLTKDGQWHEVSATAFMDEYSTNQNLWKKMPHVMLAKCAEASALRRAFPAELSGVYAPEEMDQANEESVQVSDISPQVSDAEEFMQEVVEVKDAYDINNEQLMLISDVAGIEDHATLKKYMSECCQKYKMPAKDAVEKWSSNPDNLVKCYNKWIEKNKSQ